MKLALVAVLVMLSATAMASQDSRQLGPYAVSFDINSNYEAQIASPIKSDAVNNYQMRLFVNNSTYAVISITEYADPTDATLKIYKSMMPTNMILLDGLNTTNIEDRIIDGKTGFLVTSVPFKTNNMAPSVVYRAMYWLDSKNCECGPVSVGKTNVVVTSTFSKYVTDSLLSSLHIVKG